MNIFLKSCDQLFLYFTAWVVYNLVKCLFSSADLIVYLHPHWIYIELLLLTSVYKNDLDYSTILKVEFELVNNPSLDIIHLLFHINTSWCTQTETITIIRKTIENWCNKLLWCRSSTTKTLNFTKAYTI